MNRTLLIVLAAVLLISVGIWFMVQPGVTASGGAQESESEMSAESSENQSGGAQASDVQSGETGGAASANSEDATTGGGMTGGMSGGEVTGGSVSVPEGYSVTPYLSDTQQRTFSEPQQVLEENTDYAAMINTNEGTLVVDLYEDRTPETVNSFVFLARNRFYDGVVFHRVLQDFMAQTGDPTGTGTGGPGYEFGLEVQDDLTFDEAGVLGMARTADPDSNGSQFFITLTATPFLNGEYTVFGDVIDGIDVLDNIQRINPQEPEVVVPLDITLEDLSAQGINIPGTPDMNAEAALTETLGAMPAVGQTFQIAGYTGVIGRSGQDTVIGFFPKPDVIESVTVIQRPAEASN